MALTMLLVRAFFSSDVRAMGVTAFKNPDGILQLGVWLSLSRDVDDYKQVKSCSQDIARSLVQIELRFYGGAVSVKY